MSLLIARRGLLLLVGVAALFAPQLANHAHAATSITVDASGSANNVRDTVLTLREAMLLANGDLAVGALTPDECDQVSTAFLLGGTQCTTVAGQSPGAGSADTIVFDPGVFSPDSISLGGPLPTMSTGSDTVSGADVVGVVLFGNGSTCFDITSSNNTIEGLTIDDCDNGVHLHEGASDNIIGGTSAAQRNIISGNSGTGVRIDGAGTSDNLLIGNYIGTDATGAAASPNPTGVRIRDGATGNVIGGDTSGERNVISGNTFAGVSIVTSATDGNVIQGNYIGVDVSGNAALPNDIGISISEVRGTIIGGGNPGEGNVISGNTRFAVEIGDPGTENNSVIGNRVGTNAAGNAPIGNDVGVDIAAGAALNTIGGDQAGDGNLIAFNASAGIGIDGIATTRNTVRGNSIHSNGGQGIKNTNGGNQELPPPNITGFGSVFGTACGSCIIDLFSDLDDEGVTYEGSTVADPSGDWSFTGAPLGPNVTATATDAAGNTSEFSAPASVPATPTPTPSPQPSLTPTPTPTTPPGNGLTQGDNDCDGDSDAVDALVSLQTNAGIDPNQQPSCPDIGAAVPASGEPPLFGDIDCDNDVDAVDALQILRNVAGLPVNANPGCTPIGQQL